MVYDVIFIYFCYFYELKYLFYVNEYNNNLINLVTKHQRIRNKNMKKLFNIILIFINELNKTNSCDFYRVCQANIW